MKRILFCIPVLLICFCLLFASCEREHQHDWQDWVVTREPTCTTTGERRRECPCGSSGTETLQRLPHNYEQGVCTECGAMQPADGAHDPSLPFEGLE